MELTNALDYKRSLAAAACPGQLQARRKRAKATDRVERTGFGGGVSQCAWHHLTLPPCSLGCMVEGLADKHKHQLDCTTYAFVCLALWDFGCSDSGVPNREITCPMWWFSQNTQGWDALAQWTVMKLRAAEMKVLKGPDLFCATANAGCRTA
jgi:hypothetical protein